MLILPTGTASPAATVEAGSGGSVGAGAGAQSLPGPYPNTHIWQHVIPGYVRFVQQSSLTRHGGLQHLELACRIRISSDAIAAW